jgi:ABC-2 type transport system permease protein
MSKVLAVAVREYRAAVQTKAFIISLLMMPLLMFGSIGLQRLVRQAEDRTTKKFAVVDRTPGRQLSEALDAAVERRNRMEVYGPETGEQTAPKFELVPVEPSAGDRAAVLAQRYELSQRSERGEFEGFLDIGPDVIALGPSPGDSTAGGANKPADEGRELRYQTSKSGGNVFTRWAERAVNEAIQQRRFAERQISQDVVRSIQQPVRLRSKGLTKRDPATGELRDASDESRLANVLVPLGLIMLMFMLILVGASPAMQGVVEEKQQRIAEVLLGSMTPFALMLGKLLGVVAVALTVGGIYLGGGYLAASRYGWTDALSPTLLAWFVVYLVLAVFMYASLFIAVGAAANDIKETQALLTPVMLLAALPMMLLGAVVQNPNGPVAVVTSYFPFSTPMMMIARIAAPPGLPWWQPALGAVLVLVASLACVWAAGRIFRVGFLMQGKGVKLSDLARWVVSG